MFSRRRALAGTLVLGVLLTAPAAFAAQGSDLLDELEVALTLDLNSKYVWRGINTVDEPVLQPSVDLSLRGFALNVWANLDLTDENDDRLEFSEVDVTASYTLSLEAVEVGVGLITYFFPSVGGDTTELFASVTANALFSPTLTVSQDVDEVDGTYVALGASHTFEDPFELGESVGLSPELSVSVGYGSRDYNEAYYGDRGAGFADLTLGLTFPFRLTDAATLGVSVNYSMLLRDDIRDLTDDEDNLWFGVSFSIGF